MPRAFPFTGWIRPDRDSLRADAIAGATVAVVAIPQALAYAQLAGVPAHVGLYAAFVPTIVAALWGSCAQLSTGPVALTSLLVAALLGPMAPAGSPGFVALAVLLALMSGALQWVAGLCNAGALVERVPPSVTRGFVNAAGLMIIFSQVPTLFGLDSPGATTVFDTMRAVVRQWAQVDGATLAFGVVSLLVMLLLRARWPRLPGPLLVMSSAVLVSGALGFAGAGGAVVGDLPPGLPAPALPAVAAADVVALLPAAIAIALVSFIEVMSSCRAITARTGAQWNVNQELVGQGMAKVASGLFGAFPVSGSFSRSALTFSSHARTAWSSLICAVLVGLALLLATGALHDLPRAVLAAVIMMAVSGLLSPADMLRLWRQDRREGLAALATFAATLATAPSIHYGLGVGILVWWGMRRAGRSTQDR